MTVIIQNPTDCCDPLYACECCLQRTRGAVVTIAGFADDFCTNCPDINRTLYIPAIPDVCGGSVIEMMEFCPEHPGMTDVHYSWAIQCDNGQIRVVVQIYLSLLGRVEFRRIVTDDFPIDCSVLNGDVPLDYVGGSWCDATSATATIALDLG